MRLYIKDSGLAQDVFDPGISHPFAIRIRSMTLEHPRVLLFDIDGTLLDAAGQDNLCLSRALEDVFGCTGPMDIYDMSGKTDWQIVTDLMTLAGLAPEVVEARRPEAFAAYARHVEMMSPMLKMRLLPGVGPLLTQLAYRPEFILGLVTGNVREAVPYKLRSAGLDPALFRFGAFGSEHPDRNTLPALALYRLEQTLGVTVPPEQVWVIGDTPRDIACARHAGAKVLCVTTGRYDREALAEHQPDYLLDDLSDTEAVLSILQGF